MGSDITIGVDTALNIALEAIDRLKITASSHQRAFLIEVMGRNCGYLALMAAIAGGAEYVVLPEVDTDPEKIAESFLLLMKKGNRMPLSWWLKEQNITPTHWMHISRNIVNDWDLICE